MVEFGYHGEWYTLPIIDIIDWNDLEKFVYRKTFSPRDLFFGTTTLKYNSSAKIRPQVKIHDFAIKNSNIVIEGIIWKKRDYLPRNIFET